MGKIWDGIKDATGITDVENFGKGVAKDVQDMTNATAITDALRGKADQGGHNDGHTTSGMDAAMQAHADQQHPVK
jgi:hypothetical protein